MYLRQSTASQVVLLGRFLSSTDGDTERTALSIANTDIKLRKHGGTTLVSKNSGGGTHIANGAYYATLDATDTDTVGQLEVITHVSTALATQRVYQVLEEAVYDALFAASAPGYVTDQPVNVTKLLGTAWLTPGTAGTPDVNVKLIGGTSQTGRDIGASVLLSNGTGTGQLKLASGYVAMTWADIAAPTTSVALTGTTIATTQKVDVETIKTNPVVNGGTITFPSGATLASTTNITAGTITTTTNLTNLPAITAGWLTATGIAADAITAAKIADGAIDAATFASGAITATVIAADAIGASELATDAVAEIAAAVWDLATSGHTTSGTFGAAMNAAGSAGDPWSTSVPGAYGAGTAGFILGTNLDAKVTTRLASTAYVDPTSLFPANFAALLINGSGHISRVTLVDTTTTNTDMLTAAGVRTAVGLATNNLDTQLGTLATSTALGSLVTTVGVAGLGLSAIPKTGYKLASDGLDSIATTAPTGVASTFPGMIVQLWRRFFKKADQTATQLKTYADNGTTVITTQAVSDDATTETQGAAS